MQKILMVLVFLCVCSISNVFAESTVSLKLGKMSRSHASQQKANWFGSIQLMTNNQKVGWFGLRALNAFPVKFSLDEQFTVKSHWYTLQVIKPVILRLNTFSVSLTPGIGPAVQRTSFDYTGEPDANCFGCRDAEFQNTYLLLSGLVE